MQMKMTAAITLAFAMVSSAGMAQNYPNRAITLLVPFAAGGATDTVSSFIYREYRDRSNVGYGTMLAMVYLIIIIVFVTLLLKLVSGRMRKMA